MNQRDYLRNFCVPNAGRLSLPQGSEEDMYTMWTCLSITLGPRPRSIWFLVPGFSAYRIVNICPAKPEWQITLSMVYKPRLRLFRKLFNKYYFMYFENIFLNIFAENAQRHHQYCSKRQNVICHQTFWSIFSNFLAQARTILRK